jgi:hypothetical protein
MREQNNWTMVSPIPLYQLWVTGQFALIDFQDQVDGEKPYASWMKDNGQYKGIGDTIVQLRGRACSGLI